MKNSKVLEPPKALSKEAKGWWNKIVSEWELDDPALLMLSSALESLDRMREAQVIIKKEGIVIKDRFGQDKQHPATLIERDAKNTMLRGLKALNLYLEPLRDRPGRPPGG